METNIELSVVVLCYRSGEAIIPFVQELKTLVKKLNNASEIILVANYFEETNDITKQIVDSIAISDSCFKVVAKPKKGMMGWDMIEGLKISKGKYICIIDGDGQFPIESIQTCYEQIQTGEFDLVKTYRIKRFDGVYRRLISVIYNIVARVLFKNINSKDINSKPKIVTREALEMLKLTSTDWFIDAEIMLNARKLDMRIYEFPISFFKNTGRASFVKFSAIFEFLKNMIMYKLGR